MYFYSLFIFSFYFISGKEPYHGCTDIKPLLLLLLLLLFAGFRFLTALVFYSQPDYLNHSHRDIDWLIVTCFMKV